MKEISYSKVPLPRFWSFRINQGEICGWEFPGKHEQQLQHTWCEKSILIPSSCHFNCKVISSMMESYLVKCQNIMTDKWKYFSLGQNSWRNITFTSIDFLTEGGIFLCKALMMNDTSYEGWIIIFISLQQNSSDKLTIDIIYKAISIIFFLNGCNYFLVHFTKMLKMKTCCVRVDSMCKVLSQ